jgi:uncharacterized protein involved in exopolysaccharide biosynthesis/Mrp family chromosome partitioning ATPase
MLEQLRVHPASFPEPVDVPRASRTEAFPIKTLFDILRRRRLAVFVCLLGTLALGAAYVVLSPKKYGATATLLIDSRLAQLSQTEASATIVDQAAVESQIELLKSEKILLAVIDKLDLVNDPEFGKRSSDETPTPTPAATELAKRKALAIMSANLWVTRVGRSYLVSVTYNSPDPAKASRIANDVADAYISDQIGAKVQAAKDQNVWLDAQVSEMRSRAALAYRAVQDFKTEHDINPLRDLGVQQDIDRVTAEASRARATTITIRAGLDRKESLLAGPLRKKGSVPDGAVLRSFADAQLDALSARFSEIESKLSTAKVADPQSAADRQSVVTALWSRIESLSQQDRADWIAASAQQQALDNQLADMRLRDTRARLVQERLRELETEAATSRSLYESYLNQLTHAAQQQPVPASDARVISAATTPLVPTTPKTALMIVLAVMGGLVLGLAMTVLLESLDDVVRTRERLEEVTGLHCLGIVPKVRWRDRRRRKGDIFERLQKGFPRLSASGPRSRGADTLRGLQLAASMGGRAGGATVVGVTSAVPGEGKSTIVANLGVSAERAGRRVLLVDCNRRHPSLSDVVRPEATLLAVDGSLHHVVTMGEGLDILPLAGADDIDGAELPDPQVLDALIGEARARYDLIILDLPAILPLSELRSMTHLMDTVVLVTRWGKTTRAQVDRALARLAMPDRLLGAVLNRVTLGTMRRFEGSKSHIYADRA